MIQSVAWGFVYIIHSDSGLHKIGLSKHPQKRLAEHRCNYPDEILEMIRTIETEDMRHTERQLHNIFSRRHVTGEWFALQDSDFAMVDLIERNIKAYIEELR